MKRNNNANLFGNNEDTKENKDGMEIENENLPMASTPGFKQNKIIGIY